MERSNDWIMSVGNSKRDDRMILNVWEDKSHQRSRMITVPIDAPLIDPYDPREGKGFMTPNAIIKGGLSTNAKLAFIVLRSFICYNLGVVFPDERSLEQRMGKERKAIRRAIKELEQHGIIRIKKMMWQGNLKNYYYLEPESKWRLPELNKRSRKKNEQKQIGGDDDEQWGDFPE